MRTLTSLFIVSALYGFAIGGVSAIGVSIGTLTAQAHYENK